MSKSLKIANLTFNNSLYFVIWEQYLQLSGTCSAVKTTIFLSKYKFHFVFLWFLLFFMLILNLVYIISISDDCKKLTAWSQTEWQPDDASDGSEVGSVWANGQRGGACAAGGAEGHEATQEGGGASQVSSDLWGLSVSQVCALKQGSSLFPGVGPVRYYSGSS